MKNEPISAPLYILGTTSSCNEIHNAYPNEWSGYELQLETGSCLFFKMLKSSSIKEKIRHIELTDDCKIKYQNNEDNLCNKQKIITLKKTSTR